MKNRIENPNEIVYLQASESYSVAIKADGKIEMKSRPMKYFAESLSANG